LIPNITDMKHFRLWSLVRWSEVWSTTYVHSLAFARFSGYRWKVSAC